ncbi:MULTISPECIES: hypothetical protein [Lysinibacillus]|uniref:hypothetical protein n=1 Tax=Lysinibacillus TaxID=400634 RepID=UPI00083C9751|nr:MULTISPECIES: hypothetical protein [Lysinibacillus]
MEAEVVSFQWVFKRILNEDKAPADVTNFERNELCVHNSKSGRNYAKAKLIVRDDEWQEQSTINRD